MTCTHDKSDVVDSRRDATGMVSRRRECRHCGHRWPTVEVHADEWRALTMDAKRDDVIAQGLMRILAEHGYVTLEER